MGGDDRGHEGVQADLQGVRHRSAQGVQAVKSQAPVRVPV